ncbi:proton channel OTOP2 [Lagopus muta]|uniref:proton channel OTOP2 n=1 Tax=Lagopus muta TaxID=64668 RepID=UPI0020A1A8DF|nr:proton channel OTOP2 [Lagopus muta]XP_048820980.1 proton channel OTOP2 [Lagopus muta]
MTEEPARKNSEIRRSDSMGCGSKDDKASLASNLTISLSPQPHQPSTPGSKEVWKKGGRMFSILLAVHLALLACTLVSSGAFERIAVHDYDVFFLLTVMMLIVIIWIIFYLISTSRCPDAILCKDSHAGPIWLRGGLILFAIFSLVMDVFKIGYYSSFYSCLSAIKIMYPIVQAIFVVVQTYFLWISAKDCVHVHLNVTRCGLMLTLTTNLAVWMSAVTDESVHKAHSKLNKNTTEELYRWLLKVGMRSGSTEACNCDSQICEVFKNGYFWLYPFNIEYSLFASAMVYVMWKNVGRFIDHHSHHVQHLKFKLFRRTFFVGIVLGLIILVGGLGVFIVYEVQVNSSTEPSKNSQALTMYYIFNIVCLGLMSLVCIGGSVIYRFDKRDMDRHKNPTRTLDVALLMGAALGQYAISYYSIVAIVASTPRDAISALNLTYALLMIAQHTFQNIFIIEGLHRQPPKEDHKHGSHQKELYGLTFVNVNAVSLRVPDSGSASAPNPAPSTEGTHPSDIVRSLVAPKKINWQRKLLREISMFLLLCNIILWIMPAFGARPQFDNDTELNFYGDSMWPAIVDICLPFGIFYRMHAVASLLEVCIMS